MSCHLPGVVMQPDVVRRLATAGLIGGKFDSFTCRLEELDGGLAHFRKEGIDQTSHKQLNSHLEPR